MRNLNQVTAQGNLGNTPEIIENEHGKVVYFSVACTNTFKNSKDEKISHTAWINVMAKGKTAEYAAKYFEKGDRVTITGELRTKSKEIAKKNYTFTTVLLDQILKEGK